MSAIETASRIIVWAKSSANRHPPRGDLRSAEQLANPGVLSEELEELWRGTAARMRISLDTSNGSIGVGSVILAAAAGVLHLKDLSSVVLDILDQKSNPNDMVVRHGVVGPLLRFLNPEHQESFLRHSPLTSILSAPIKKYRTAARSALSQLIGIRDFRSAILRAWVAPGRSSGELRWQASVLDRWRLGEDEDQRRFVLDVYEAAFVYHQEETLERINGARNSIRDAVATSNNEQLDDALAVADWWGPLWHLERAELDQLRKRPHLGYRYHDGLALYALGRRLTGGVAA